MGVFSWRRRKPAQVLATGAVVAALVATSIVTTATAAQADISPLPNVPATVGGALLPTVQMNGVAWDQEVVGNTVYVAGSFTQARPFGAAAGTSETPRANMLAYDVTTGVLDPNFAPVFNGQVRQVAVSPDKTRLYVVGDFTTVNGVTRSRAASFDLPSGTLNSWNPAPNGSATGVEATASTIYLVGTFGRISGNDRSGAAAVTPDGTLLPWAPTIGERGARVVVATADASRVTLGGQFYTVNGSKNPGHGLAIVDGATGAVLPTPANNVIRNAGTAAAITALKSDGQSVYGTGYSWVSRGDGRLEGAFRMSWADGTLTWVNDCHGDSYDLQPLGDAIYIASHAHYCGSLVDGFPQTNPWSYHRATAVSKDAVRITPSGLNRPSEGYYDFGGNPAPRLLHWFPSFNSGTYTGQTQGPWTVNGNDKYLVYGGEFTKVNGAGQQGLARFAVPGVAGALAKPALGGNAWVPTTAADSNGGVRVNFPMNYDPDSEYLTYTLLRDGTVVAAMADIRSKTKDWGLGNLSIVDSTAVPGTTYSYQMRASDNEGNSIVSAKVNGSATRSATANKYRDSVMADAPQNLWLFEETSGRALDTTGRSSLTLGSGTSLRGEGQRTDATSSGMTASGGSAQSASSFSGPNTFGLEAWFKTTSSSGGNIITFGKPGGWFTSENWDRNIYMGTDGRLNFGVYPGSRKVITSADSYNDGKWHHVAAGLGSTGMTLHVDGALVSSNPDVTTGESNTGYWNVGGKATWVSSNANFNGTIDDVAVYSNPLTTKKVQAHYNASGRSVPQGATPTDAYGKAVVASGASQFWRLGDAADSSSALDSSGQARNAVYSGAVARGTAGALSGQTDTAADFSGGQVIGRTAYTSPKAFSAEAWFKTTTTAGGKIVGLGNSNSTTASTTSDRGIHMNTDGTVALSVNDVNPVDVRSTEKYNDGKWHHVVGSQGPSGMRLFVDGNEVARNNAQVAAAQFTGYWHVGGDRVANQSFSSFAGAIDEVAIYDRAISAIDVASHYSLGSSGKPANVLPTALFTHSLDASTVSVDGSTSTDSDGKIASYSWNWGDGTPVSTGATATHKYLAGGTYTITLTVTDDRGGQSTRTAAVTVIGNAAPTAVLASKMTGMGIEVDATGSTDAEGAIASYSWNFGDGTPAVAGATASHTYAVAGPYTVTLTVTDADGATGTATTTVTAAAPVFADTWAADGFERAVTSGLGSATTGGDWTTSAGAANYAVADGSAVFRQATGGALRYAYLPSVGNSDTAVQTTVVLPALPVGGSAYASVIARRVGTSDYTGRAIVAASGAVTLQLMRGTTVLTSVNTGITVTAGTPLHMRVEATGTSPTTVRAKAWTTLEPGTWTTTTTDNTAALQAAGHVGLGVYLGGSVSNVPFVATFTDLWAGATTGLIPTQNTPPVAEFTATSDLLVASFDASASSDADGSVASYAWDFGDGATGVGATVQHTYAAAGTYKVRVTVTDDKGATGTVTKDVAVAAAPAENQAPVAKFTSSVKDLTVALDGSTSTDADGTVATYAWNFGDEQTGEGATASHTYAAAGTYTVRLTVTDDKGATASTTAEVVVDEAPVAEPALLADDFNRANGKLGTAKVGGNWSGNATAAVIQDEQLKITSSAGAQTIAVNLMDTPSDSTDTTVSFRLTDDITAGRMFVSVVGRNVTGAGDYRGRWLVGPNGALQSQLAKGGTVISWKDVPGLTIKAGETYKVRLQVTGTGTTTLRSKIWLATETEPTAWALESTDTTANLQVAGGVGLTTYTGGTFAPLPTSVFFDDLVVTKVAP